MPRVHVTQTQALGLGHAILCAEKVIGDEPFAVILPDDVISATRPCLQQMVEDDNDRTIDFLAINPSSGEVLASAMLGADEKYETAEFAICTREDMKQRGISWALLDYAARYAEAMGIRKITSLESAQQKDGLALEREMGFTIRPCPEDDDLIIAEKAF